MGRGAEQGRTAPPEETWSFHCSACGKCCNSAPPMSVAELLYHQHRFIGCLAVRRVPQMQPGDPLGSLRANETDCQAHRALADAIFHPLPNGDHVLLATHAFGADAPDACPMLGHDMRCMIHDDRKPVACSVVPLDALVPDRLQHAVLAERAAEAVYLGADCIARGTGAPSLPVLLGTRAPSLPVVRGAAVIDDSTRAALARHRKSLSEEKARWGNAVFGLLSAELFSNPVALARVPVQGFLVMAIAPVLLVVAASSPGDRRRCLEYIDAQVALIDGKLRAAGAPRGAAGAQLQAFARTHRALRTGLEKAIA